MMGDNGVQATMPMTPAGQNAGMFGGDGGFIWILILFLFMGGGRGGLFGNNDGAAVTSATNMLNNDFLYSQTKIDNLTSGMNAGFNALQMGLCNLGHQVDTGFCDIRHSIDSLRFDAAQNTCTITNAIGASTQAILGHLTNQEIASLREQLQASQARENNAYQTANLQQIIAGQFEQHFPCARPAYLSNPPGPTPFVGSYVMGGYGAPFRGFDGHGHGCNDGCHHGIQ